MTTKRTARIVNTNAQELPAIIASLMGSNPADYDYIVGKTNRYDGRWAYVVPNISVRMVRFTAPVNYEVRIVEEVDN